MSKLLRSIISAILLVLLNCPSFSQEIEFPADRKGRANLLDGTSLNFRRINFSNDTANCHLKDNIILNYPSEKIYSLEIRKTRVVEMTLAFTGLGLTLGLLSAYALNKTAADDMKRDFIIIYTSVFAVGGFILGISLPKYKTIYIKDQALIRWQPDLLYADNSRKVYAGFRAVIFLNANHNKNLLK